MEKKVTVIENNKDGLKVGCDSSLCSGCKSEMFCRGRDTTFEVENPKGFKVEKGDRILVDVPEGKATVSVLLSLGLPLILFLPGYYLGSLIAKSEISMAFTGLSFMGLGFLISALIFRIKKHYFSPTLEDKE